MQERTVAPLSSQSRPKSVRPLVFTTAWRSSNDSPPQWGQETVFSAATKVAGPN